MAIRLLIMFLGCSGEFINQVAAAAIDKNNMRLSDKLRDLSSTYPETKLLEHKLTKMVKLQPELTNSLRNLNKLTTFSADALASSSNHIRHAQSTSDETEEDQSQSEQPSSHHHIPTDNQPMTQA